MSKFEYPTEDGIILQIRKKNDKGRYFSSLFIVKARNPLGL